MLHPAIWVADCESVKSVPSHKTMELTWQFKEEILERAVLLRETLPLDFPTSYQAEQI